ncbi:MAG: PilZ domain-containing protein [Gammaproteobacteria bacterium]|nr:PilZ domain-containing protein [Gammaproteobacteria bacterium]
MRPERIEREEDVFVDVIQCQENPDLNQTSMSCRTLDVSQNGLKLVTGLLLPPATVLGLRLDLSSVLYRLEGEVRWCLDDHGCRAGLLLDRESPDFDAWIRMFEPDIE